MENQSEQPQALTDVQMELDNKNQGSLTHRPRDLSVASKAYDRGNKGYLDSKELMVRKYDSDGDGKISLDDVFNIVEDAKKEERGKHRMKKMVYITGVIALLVFVSSFGLSWAVVVLSRKIEPSKDNDLVTENSREVLATRAKGFIIHATPDPDFAARARRHLFGLDTEEDRRLQGQSDDLHLIGTGNREEIEAAYVAVTRDNTVVKISVPSGPITYTKEMDTTEIALHSFEDNTKVYTGLRLEGHTEPWFQLHCKQTETICEAYSEGYFDTSVFATQLRNRLMRNLIGDK